MDLVLIAAGVLIIGLAMYVILDGLGDDPIPELDGKTPLEAAATPNAITNTADM